MSETPEQAAWRLLKARGLVREGDALTVHTYADANCKPLHWAARLKHADGDKNMRPMHVNGNGYKLSLPPAPETGRPLYRLDKLAADTGAVAYVVEGEACADAMDKLDLLATTSGSASSADAADWTPLQGRDVILWPDHDEPGQAYADTVAKHLRALGCDVRTIAADVVDALPAHGDVVDWLEQHPDATAADVVALPAATLAKTGGDTGENGEAMPCNGSRVPSDAGQAGESGDMVGMKQTPDGTLLPHYVVNETGVFFVDSDGTEWEPPAWICAPLRVAAMTRDTQNSEWGRLLVFHDADGNEHRWACPQSLHAGNGDELRATLLREGLTINTSNKARRRLGDYIQQAMPDVRARCVTRTGWHGDAFALPRETYGDTDAEPVLFQAASLDGVTLGQCGDVQAWTDNVAKPCAGNARLVLAVCMGFAGPCLGLVRAEGGGVHLRGPSSSGKSTALHVAASLYGPPGRYAQTWRATDNGLEGTCARHSDLLLVLDELGQLEPKHAGHVAYMVANGQGKARSNRDGSPRPVAEWRVLFLSAGELGLGELVTQSGGRLRAGQEVRVIDVPADAGAGLGLFDAVPDGMMPGTFADRLKAASAKHYGTALPVFLDALTADPDKSRETLQALRADIASGLTPADAPGQVRRVADRFALVAAAGELATAWELTGWGTGEAEKAAQACFRAWQDARDTPGNAEPAAMLAQVRAFLEAHGEARFTRWDADNNTPRTANRAGYRKGGSDGPSYYIEPQCFRREVCKSFDHHAVAHVLADRHAMERGGDGRETRKTLLPDGRNVRVYVVTPALWGDE